MIATGTSNWAGNWKEGSGTISTKSDTLKNSPYSFSSRFEGTPGASPEELLAAAHAACFNQALSNVLGQNGFLSEVINTSVDIELGYGEDKHPAIKSSHFTVTAKVSGITNEEFQKHADRSRQTCTISKILNIEITLNATLIS